MGNERDVFEWRRFGHWATRAEKARFAAYLLWYSRDTARLNDVIQQCRYTNGDADLAVIEAFRRESAVALELIVKAVIAMRLERREASSDERVPANHDIPRLWKEASLPELQQEDQYRLLLTKSVLIWSGRYETPRTEKAWQDQNQAFDKLVEVPSTPGTLVVRSPITIGWPDFDRLYQIARTRLIQAPHPT